MGFRPGLSIPPVRGRLCLENPERGNAVRYLCLVYAEERKLSGMTEAECTSFDASIRDSGHCLASEVLEPVATATTVRVRHGKVSVADGPFAETEEQLVRFYMIEARDLNEAIQVASRIPPARMGSVEVRPVSTQSEGPST